MVNFDGFKASGGNPIYLQIIYFVKRGIASGAIADGDEMPSRRVLSALLGINPNTVQKAFRALEDDGLIVSRSGAKSYVSAGPERIEALKSELLKEDLLGMIDALRQSGVSLEEAIELIRANWGNNI